MNKKIGFIGCGHMASAIIKGLEGNFEMIGCEITEEVATGASQRLSIPVITDACDLVDKCDVIFVATKPNCVNEILQNIKNNITDDKLLVSIAAGISTEKINEQIGEKRVVRVMPNTPALIKEGMCAVCKGKFATDDDLKFVEKLLFSIGKCITLDDEAQMDIVTAISGSGPAFYYQVINAIARAGERLGMDYDKALLLSTQTAIGSAKMLMQSDKTPEELIDSVATKGGCTEVGVSYFQNEKMDELFFNLIKKTTEKAHALGK